MSFDGPDESSGGGGDDDAETDLTSPQVPCQGGRAGRPPADDATADDDTAADRPTAGHPTADASAEAGVPAQRDRWDARDSAVSPLSLDLPDARGGLDHLGGPDRLGGPDGLDRPGGPDGSDGPGGPHPRDGLGGPHGPDGLGGPDGLEAEAPDRPTGLGPRTPQTPQTPHRPDRLGPEAPHPLDGLAGPADAADSPESAGLADSAGSPDSADGAGDDAGDTGVLPPPRALPPADATLVERMRAGDDSAYEELYRRHAGAVRRYARTCCRDGHTADDLTAEVFARMLQAVRGGAGPEHAVRAYLLTSVRRVAARWTKSAGREQLIDDFAVFAAQSARLGEPADDTAPPGSFGAGVDVGADVRAMHEAEQSLAMRAFRSLPERWQAVLWHTEVEDESPSEVATLFGLDANGTRVLASRAREGLRQAYLQAHVSAGLTGDEECARYADQLGTYARRRLRTRAERGLRKHLEECARCRLAAVQIEEVASGIPAVVPVAVIGWFGAAGYAKAAAVIAGGAGAAGAAGAAAAGGGSSGGAGSAALSEGLGAPVKAGIAAGVVAVAAAAIALALAGEHGTPKKPLAAPPPPSAPVVAPRSPAPSHKASPAPAPPVLAQAVPAAAPTPTPAHRPTPAPTPGPSTPAAPAPAPTPSPSPTPTPS
ncbi:RNA polymerase sigma factor, partial [Streptomyces mangrovisoli]|uniref:RNA polymerase sigma factor n=1 Tax=Streptomyces mangrovisoli TaxID=1428628 RepID=UPI001F0ADC6B